MIKINSNTLVYTFLASVMAYMAHVATSLQDFLVMLLIAIAVPTLTMSVVVLSNKREEYKRRANYFRSKDAWKKNNNKKVAL